MFPNVAYVKWDNCCYSQLIHWRLHSSFIQYTYSLGKQWVKPFVIIMYRELGILPSWMWTPRPHTLWIHPERIWGTFSPEKNYACREQLGCIAQRKRTMPAGNNWGALPRGKPALPVFRILEILNLHLPILSTCICSYCMHNSWFTFLQFPVEYFSLLHSQHYYYLLDGHDLYGREHVTDGLLDVAHAHPPTTSLPILHQFGSSPADIQGSSGITWHCGHLWSTSHVSPSYMCTSGTHVYQLTVPLFTEQLPLCEDQQNCMV